MIKYENCPFFQDVSESLVVVGRYISENFNGVALHPIDFIDVTTGSLVAEVMDPNITTITPVNKLHPRDDVLASGSSRFVHQFIFAIYASILLPSMIGRVSGLYSFGSLEKMMSHSTKGRKAGSFYAGRVKTRGKRSSMMTVMTMRASRRARRRRRT